MHPDSIARLKQGTHRVLRMANVLGVIPGQRTDEYVIVGAHFDHLGTDETLANDAIYNGADDNASGVSAVLQIARAFQASGQKPLRNVIIAFWDGEEKGLLGSKHFVQSCDFIGKVKGYLNFDMIGRNNKPDTSTPPLTQPSGSGSRTTSPATASLWSPTTARGTAPWVAVTMPRSPCATSPSSGITPTDIPSTTSLRTTPTA